MNPEDSELYSEPPSHVPNLVMRRTLDEPSNDALIIGIDPGIVHTGIVAYAICTHGPCQIPMIYRVIDTEDAAEGERYRIISDGVSQFLEDMLPTLTSQNYAVQETPMLIFIEDYRSRASSNKPDAQMREIVSALRRLLPLANVVDNTGSKKIARPALMRSLGLNTFRATHHQDLQAASRIMIYGALKQEHLNALLAGLLDRVLYTSKPITTFPVEI